jgi:hypothetical protein
MDGTCMTRLVAGSADSCISQSRVVCACRIRMTSGGDVRESEEERKHVTRWSDLQMRWEGHERSWSIPYFCYSLSFIV